LPAGVNLIRVTGGNMNINTAALDISGHTSLFTSIPGIISVSARIERLTLTDCTLYNGSITNISINSSNITATRTIATGTNLISATGGTVNIDATVLNISGHTAPISNADANLFITSNRFTTTGTITNTGTGALSIDANNITVTNAVPSNFITTSGTGGLNLTGQRYTSDSNTLRGVTVTAGSVYINIGFINVLRGFLTISGISTVDFKVERLINVSGTGLAADNPMITSAAANLRFGGDFNTNTPNVLSITAPLPTIRFTSSKFIATGPHITSSGVINNVTQSHSIANIAANNINYLGPVAVSINAAFT
jgi:hypothetical protein